MWMLRFILCSLDLLSVHHASPSPIVSHVMLSILCSRGPAINLLHHIHLKQTFSAANEIAIATSSMSIVAYHFRRCAFQSGFPALPSWRAAQLVMMW